MPLTKNEKSGILFVAITIIWTWGVLAIPVMFGMNFENTVTKVSYILAGASPSVIGLTFLLVSRDRIYIRSFIKRLITLGNSRALVLLAVFTLVPAITLLSAYASYLITLVYPDLTILSGTLWILLIEVVIQLIGRAAVDFRELLC